MTYYDLGDELLVHVEKFCSTIASIMLQNAGIMETDNLHVGGNDVKMFMDDVSRTAYYLISLLSLRYSGVEAPAERLARLPKKKS